MGHGAIGGDNRLQYDYASQLRLGGLVRINRFDLMHYESINHFTGESNRIIDRRPVKLGQRFFKRYRRFQLRSEEHTSELQSRLHLVCRLLLEKKKKTKDSTPDTLTHI